MAIGTGSQWLAAVLLFPAGLLLLLLVDETAELQVVVRPVTGGAEVLVVGRTRRSVASTLREAFADLPGQRPTAGALTGPH